MSILINETRCDKVHKVSILSYILEQLYGL